MFILGLIATASYIPGYLGASVPTQWVLFSCLLPLGLWRSAAVDPRLPLAALGFAALSVLWAPNGWDGLYGLWLLCLWALAFHLGTTRSDFTPLWKGMAVGLYLSSLVAVAQAFKLSPLEAAAGNPGGLLFNSTLLGATCAIVLVALWQQGLFWWIHGLIPALVLSGSRGAFATLAIVFIARYVHWTVAAACLCLGAALLATSPSGSDTLRLITWGTSIPHLDPFGNGLGSFVTFLFGYEGRIYHPERMHNDYLQLIFELGLFAIPILGLYAIALSQRLSPEWPVFLAFATMGLFYFPLWAPSTSLVGCLLAGRLFADWYLARVAGLHRGHDRLPGIDYSQPFTSRPGRQALPSLPLP